MIGSLAFRISAFLPLALLLAVHFYASGFDGWGAWATGPLYLVPITVSATVTGVGLVRLAREREDGGPTLATAMLTAVAAAPLLWLAGRWLTRA